jgi:uncharacterized radical SAM protein YgiQ
MINHFLNDKSNFLPTSAKEIKQLGWKQADVILFSGDAYIDHPAFAAAVIGRTLQSKGYKVAIVPQPNWRDDLRDFKKLGEPRLFFAVSAGNMDSMVNHYTANKRLRSDDAYTPNGKSGYRPDYPSIVYTKIIKKLFPKSFVLLGGIEASMRRFTHYDYWQNKLLPSFLIDSGADALIYGQGEYPLIDFAEKFSSNKNYFQIPQLVYRTNDIDFNINNDLELASHEDCLKNKKAHADNFVKIETNSNLISGKRLIQKYKNEYIVANPSMPALSTEQIDMIFDLPYQRVPHPRYKNKGSIPAYEMIRNSINIHRGCFGACSFCTISSHQGKFISSRSEKSILNELQKIINTPGFSGHITDLGGPSANMYKMEGFDKNICSKCKKPSCIFPQICSNLDTSHAAMNQLYEAVESHIGIKKLSIGSGVRHDLIFHNYRLDKSKEKYLENLITKHTSGRLKVAPEHTSEKVLSLMRKPSYTYFEKLLKIFKNIAVKNNLNYQLIPYFISSHPGCNTSDMAELAIITKNEGYRLEQAQDFTPTPATLSTVMYYTGINPYNGKKIEVASQIEDKKAQNRYFYWYKPENKREIIKELKLKKRKDLISKLFG